MKKIINLLLYNGVSKEDYLLVTPLSRESNRHSCCFFSIVGFVAFLGAAIMKFNKDVGIDSEYFLITSLLFLIMALICFTFGKKKNCICEFFTYIINATILGVGIYSAISQPTERATLLLVFFVLCAVMFYSVMLWNILITITAEVVFIFLLYKTQVNPVLFENLINSIIFSVIGIFSSVYLMKVKCNKFLYEAKSKKLLEIDPMTSLYNRYSFNIETEKIDQSKEQITICSFDVNGLKKTNDTLGHYAGDELIIACAQCINNVFGQYGKIFRVGGDEFIAILNGDNFDENELLKQLEKCCSSWKGEYINGFTVSCGIAKYANNLSLDEVIKASDTIMYENKKHYYNN